MFAILLFSGTVFSADLPFLATDIEFEISIEPENTAGLTKRQIADLKKQLHDEILRQRATNQTLKQYEDERKIVRIESQLIEARLRSLGYYKHQVGAQFVRTENQRTTSKPGDSENGPKEKSRPDLKVTYLVQPGPLYVIEEIEIELHNEISPSSLPRLPVAVGDALAADNVFRAIDELTNYIAGNYCFFTIDIDYRAAVSHVTHSASLTLFMKRSEQVRYGKVVLEGLETVDPNYLRKKAGLKNGECFKSAAVDQGRINLLRSNLIASVNTRYSQPEKGVVDVTYLLQERHHRTIKAGIGYSTDEEFNVTAGWEHRNILGTSEKLELETKLSEQYVSFSSELDIPNFFHEDLSLNIHGDIDVIDRDYDSESIEGGAELEYRYRPDLTLSIGGDVKYSKEQRQGETEDRENYLVSFPAKAIWDTTDELLDPTSGWILSVELRPYVDFINTGTKFVKSTFSGSTYYTANTWLTPTLALRFAAGTITGEPTENIPADERYYVGGGGSVRGYPFQSLSQLKTDDSNNGFRDGGSSFQEVSAEFRFRIDQDWGFVSFIDGGYAFDETTPDLNEELFWGAGIGLRYYTLVAPVRFDVAFPLNRREGDDGYQIYINIGQAF